MAHQPWNAVARGAMIEIDARIIVLSSLTSPPLLLSQTLAARPTDRLPDLPLLQACKRKRINCPRMHACVVNGCNYPTVPFRSFELQDADLSVFGYRGPSGQDGHVAAASTACARRSN